MARFAVLLLLALPALALGQARGPNTHTRFIPAAAAAGGGPSTGINGAALNGTPASLTTANIDIEGWSVVTVQVNLTRGGSGATDLQMTCEVSTDGAAYGRYPSSTCEAGTCALRSATFTTGEASISGDAVIEFPPLTVHYKKLRCTFTGTAAEADDTIVVTFLLGVV